MLFRSMAGPVTTAISSVAVLNQIARGIIAKAEVINTARSPQCKYSAAIEIGTNTSNPNERIFLIGGILGGWWMVDGEW